MAVLSSRADEIARLFCLHPQGFDKVFSDQFRKAVPDEQLAKVLADVFNHAGRCVGVEPAADNQQSTGQFVLTFENGSTCTSHLSIASTPPHLVEGFFIGPLERSATTFADLKTELKKLPGTTSLFAAELTSSDLKPLAELNADKPMAIGSAFKLYVLAELLLEIKAGQRHWEDLVTLTEASRSLPGGFLQSWPVGSPVTLHTLASLMISQSDNTATDNLIRTLGRVKIESMLSVAGNSKFSLNQPFLTTLEMFKIKGDPSHKLAEEYLGGSNDARRQMLEDPIAKMSRDRIDFPHSPSHIDTIEWFATTKDLARAMLWLKNQTGDASTRGGREVLAINPGLQFSRQKWSYIGYKGGSEPGVLNLTYLLQQAGTSDRWLVVSLTWNNPDHALDEGAFFPLVQQAVELAGQN